MKEREKLPNWEHLWFDLVQEEIRQNTKDVTSSKGGDEENFALVGKVKKGKGKESQTKPESSQGGRRNTFPKKNASIFINSSTMPRSVHTKI